MSDLDSVKKNNIQVMSTFSCGGGSSMGYKRAGCTILAANDIDTEMAYHYKLNLNPKHYFLCPISDLITATLPPELFNLDILDGSPPCSTFSLCGLREKSWGKSKYFREGQSKQILSDLFFDYLDLVGRLRPKVAIAENVKGMIIGNAKGYTKMIYARFKELGYRPQIFLLNAADCGVPQRRERVFFCAIRDDIDAPPLKLAPNYKWISASECINDLQVLTLKEIEQTKPTLTDLRYWNATKPGNTYSVVCKKQTGKNSCFNHYRLNKNLPTPTIVAQTDSYNHWDEMRGFTFRELKRFGSFPDDYQAKTNRIGNYMVGMSVPPKMTEYVAREVCKQWLGVV